MRSGNAAAARGCDVGKMSAPHIFIEQACAFMRVILKKLLHFRVNISRYSQDITPSVIIEIKKTRTPLYIRRMIKTCGARSVFKETAPGILIEHWQVIRKMGLEDVRQPVMIKIASRYAHA